MKKILFMLLCVIVTIQGVAREFSYTYSGQTLNYSVIDEVAKSVMVASNNDISGDLEIPSVAKDMDNAGHEVIYSVIAIGQNSFKDCTGLTSVTIPETVNSIGSDAFFNCTNLTKAEFASIEAICKMEFVRITSNPLNYAHHLYIDDEEVTEVVIPESVTSIEPFAFAGCSGMTSVSFPQTLTVIEWRAF